MNYKKILLKGSFFLSMADLSTKVIGFLLLPLFTFYLSPEDFGIISITFLIVSILNLFYNPGIISAIQRLYHANDNLIYRQELIGSAYVFFISTPLIVLLTALLFGDFIFLQIFKDFKFFPYGLIAIFLSFVTQPKRLWINLLTLTYEVKKIAIYTTISVFLGLLVSYILVVFFQMGAMGRVIGAFPGAILLFIISSKEVIKYSKLKWSFKKLKIILKFGTPLIIAIISYEFLHIADRFIIEHLIGIAALGIYSFSYTICEAQRFVMVGLNKLFSPIFYENMNKKNYILIKQILSYYIILLTTINLIIILFSNEIVLFFIDLKFHESIILIPVICMGLFFNGLLLIFTSSLSFKNKFGSISKIAFISSILNIVLNLILIPSYGIVAAAYSTLISYVIYFIIGFFIEFKSIKTFTNLSVLFYSLFFLILSFIVVIFFSNNQINLVFILSKMLLFSLFIVLLFYFKFLKLYYFSKLYLKIKKFLNLHK